MLHEGGPDVTESFQIHASGQCDFALEIEASGELRHEVRGKMTEEDLNGGGRLRIAAGVVAETGRHEDPFTRTDMHGRFFRTEAEFPFQRCGQLPRRVTVH